MSEAYWCAPVTNARPSTFGDRRAGDRPLLGRRRRRVARRSTFISFWPLVSSPNVNDGLPSGPLTLPSATVERLALDLRLLGGQVEQQLAGGGGDAAELAGHVAASCGCRTVPPSYGHQAVSAITSGSTSTGTCSSSATTCVSDVRMFWPTSTLPV